MTRAMINAINDLQRKRCFTWQTLKANLHLRQPAERKDIVVDAHHKRFQFTWCYCFVCTLLIFVCMLLIFETCIYGIPDTFFNTRLIHGCPFMCFLCLSSAWYVCYWSFRHPLIMTCPYHSFLRKKVISLPNLEAKNILLTSMHCWRSLLAEKYQLLGDE